MLLTKNTKDGIVLLLRYKGGSERMALGEVLCKLGLHRLVITNEDSFRTTGDYWGLCEYVLQTGIKKCTRSSCHFEKKVWRSGWTGCETLSGIDMGRWKKLRKSKEGYIKSLDYRQLMG